MWFQVEPKVKKISTLKAVVSNRKKSLFYGKLEVSFPESGAKNFQLVIHYRPVSRNLKFIYLIDRKCWSG